MEPSGPEARQPGHRAHERSGTETAPAGGWGRPAGAAHPGGVPPHCAAMDAGCQPSPVPTTSQQRVITYIYGYNLYHRPLDARFHTSWWLDLAQFGRSLLTSDQPVPPDVRPDLDKALDHIVEQSRRVAFGSDLDGPDLRDRDTSFAEFVAPEPGFPSSA